MKKQTKTTTTNKCNVAKTKPNYFVALGRSPLAVILLLAQLICLLPVGLAEQLKVVYAVNAGGDGHTDRNGIHYEADPLNVGIASDYGKHLLMIGRVHEHDEVLYRTERYHTANFGYEFPSDGDGDYALIMKFCEVYFDAPNRKVFDVLLNRKHTVVRQLDIYNEVGRGSAHDEIVYFKISNGRLHYNREFSDVRNGRLRLDFIKGDLDNPKINAFALLKGDINQLPRVNAKVKASEHSDGFADTDDSEFDALLDETNAAEQLQHAPQQQQQERIVSYNEPDELDEDFEDELPDEETAQQKQQPQATHNTRLTSGPRQPNPYTMDDSSILLPVFIAIGAFIPLLFCLCKL